MKRTLLYIAISILMGILSYSDVCAQEEHTITLTAKPAMAGTFNTSSATLTEGESIQLMAYSNGNFTFLQWTDEEGNIVSPSQSFTYRMPSRDIHLTAEYQYNPTNPSNPGKNYWNAETGEVIVDDFTAGSLSSAVNTAIGGSSYRDQVQMVTVSGSVNQSDWGVIGNYSNCTFLDMSRTYGLTSVPSYNFSGNTTLTSVSLPSGIEAIQTRAFSGCTALSSLSCHAATPPTIGSNAFYGVTDMVVYVPADALSLYQEAEGWKDYTILPLSTQVSALEVNLPDGTDPTLYKDMYVELINTNSGQKLRYVITNRTTYTFNSLVNRTQYNVYLKNTQGNVLGEIDGVSIDDHDVSVTFESLMVPQDVTLNVLTPDGTDVTANTTITWMDKEGTFLSKGSVLAGQLEGVSVKFRITLPQTLAMQYVMPEDSLYEVLATGNTIGYTLTALPQLTISGTVSDVKTGKALSGATVSISQTLNGQYSKIFSAKTNTKGEWQQTVFQAPTDITASMTDYVSQSRTARGRRLREEQSDRRQRRLHHRQQPDDTVPRRDETLLHG